MPDAPDPGFRETVEGLLAGDFSRLAPLFSPEGSMRAWFDAGAFADQPAALEEAFTCACFLGCTRLVEHFLSKGLSPTGGARTGLNAVHWAANRGQLSTVELLLRHHAPLETKNSYGGTVLGCAVWSAVHEPKPDHLQIIEALLSAGANPGAAEFPSGHPALDALLQRYRTSGTAGTGRTPG